MIATEHRLVAARHESAHALAYLHHGLSVDTIDIDEGGGGLTTGGVRAIRPRTAGRIKMVGCAIELEWFTAQLGQPEAIRQAVKVWRETATCALDNEDWSARDDALTEGGMIMSAAPWAMAFVAINQELITELGTLLIKSGGHLEQDTFMPLVDGRIQAVPDADMVTAARAFQPHAAMLSEIERIAREWGQQAARAERDATQ